MESCNWKVKCPEIVSLDETIPNGGLDLVFVDIPGINCPDKGDAYKTYVSENFSDFDYFLIMVDGEKLIAQNNASEMGSPDVDKVGKVLLLCDACITTRCAASLKMQLAVMRMNQQLDVSCRNFLMRGNEETTSVIVMSIHKKSK